MGIKVLTVLGTRPEAIKLAPVIKELERVADSESASVASASAGGAGVRCRVCAVAQHRELLDPFLRLFEIEPDWDLDLMQPDQTPSQVAAGVLERLPPILEQERPDWVLVQGDTTTAFAAALAAFYSGVRVAHVEAGLRSYAREPFPEELNRRLISHLAELHFAPTLQAKENLLREGIPPERVHVTGNTVIDALYLVLGSPSSPGLEMEMEMEELGLEPQPGAKLILVTLHRRESFGERLEEICLALRQLIERNSDIELVWPVHLNPHVQEPVRRLLGGVERVHLIEPLNYPAFIKLMERAYLVLTDSGGIQEEAPALDKPVLILRNRTERPEVLKTGAAKLVGTSPPAIIRETERLLRDQEEYRRMAAAENPYGDGHAAERIVSILLAQGSVG